MLRTLLLAATAGVSACNGLHFSPLVDPVFFMMRPFVTPLVASPPVLLYVASIFIVVMTMALAGIPAAIYERVRGEATSTPVSLAIWFVAACVVALPGLLGASGYFNID